MINRIMNGGSCYEGRQYWLSGISGGNYYWYLRAVIISGIIGRRYYSVVYHSSVFRSICNSAARVARLPHKNQVFVQPPAAPFGLGVQLPQKYRHTQHSPDEPAKRHALPQVPRTPARRGPAEASAPGPHRGERGMVTTGCPGSNAGNHASPPALPEDQTCRALLRCCANQGAAGKAPG